MPAVDERPLLTAGEVAEKLRINVYSAYRLMASGDLRTIRIGKLRRVDARDLERYLEEQKERGTA